MSRRRTIVGRSSSSIPPLIHRASISSLELLELRRLLAADDLDSSFGTNGVVIDQLGAVDIGAVAVDQTSGNIAVVGDASGAAVVAQYDADGNFMWSFDLSANFGDAIDVAYDSGGRVIVAGDAATDFIVACFTSTGSPDGGFGTGGFYQHMASDTQAARGVAVRPDDSIIVVGNGENLGGIDIAVLQLDSAAVPFGLGASGFIHVDLGSTADAAGAVALQSDGTAVIAGQTTDTTQDYALVLLEPNGTLTQTVIDDGNSEVLSAVTVGPGDVIHAVGTSGLAPFLNTFDAAGARTNSTAIGFDIAGGVDADSAGNVYVTTGTVSFDTFGITRFTASGAIDGAFGTGGTVTATVPGTFAIAFDVAVNADDKPVAFGLSDGDVALARWGDDGGGGNVVTAELSGTTLTVTGTANVDDIRVVMSGSLLDVLSDNASIGTFAASGTTIVIHAGDGSDTIEVDVAVTNATEIYGGIGNDTVHGGGGRDAIFGGDGDDWLRARGDADILVGDAGADVIGGGGGRDIMIGGTGADIIAGNADSDIYISGSTDFDGDLGALKLIRAEWLSNRTFIQRVQNLRNGTGLNGPAVVLTTDTVHDDGVSDTLTGGAGDDWFLIHFNPSALDVITDLSGIEMAGVVLFLVS